MTRSSLKTQLTSLDGAPFDKEEDDEEELQEEEEDEKRVDERLDEVSTEVPEISTLEEEQDDAGAALRGVMKGGLAPSSDAKRTKGRARTGIGGGRTVRRMIGVVNFEEDEEEEDEE